MRSRRQTPHLSESASTGIAALSHKGRGRINARLASCEYSFRRARTRAHDRRLRIQRFDLEAGDALVVGGNILQLLLRQHVSDDLVAIRRALLDELHHLLRAILAVEQDETGGCRPPLRLI